MKLSNKIIIIVLLSLATVVESQAQWAWAKQLGGTSDEFGGNIITDLSGNSYFTMGSRGTCYFQTDTLSVNGYNDFFLIKYDNNGNELWVKQFGGNNISSRTESSGGICFDETSNFVYMTGRFSGVAFFGSTTLNTSSTAFFLAKFDLDGNCIWAKQSVGGNQVNGSDVTIDDFGNLYVCGINSDSTSFDSFTIPAGGFIAKYDANGNCIWAKNKFRYQAITNSEAQPSGIKTFNSSIVVSGSVTNDTIEVDTIVALGKGNNSAFITTFDLEGNARWIKLYGGNGAGGGSDFSIDNEGNSYISGIFSGIGYFDTTTLSNGMQNDAFLIKCDTNGNLKYVNQLSATGGAKGINAYTDVDKNVYMVGYFAGTANFGAYTITASSPRDMFVARYDSVGTCLGVHNFGRAESWGISSNINSYWVSGFFNSTTITIGSNNFTNFGFGSDFFIAKGDAPIGIETYQERKTANALHIYANPNKGTCNITIPDELLNEQNLVLTIYDINGKIIQQQQVQIEQEKIKINLEAEAKGIYNVTLGNAKKMYSGKIVFE